jgi:hypothetical protein
VERTCAYVEQVGAVVGGRWLGGWDRWDRWGLVVGSGEGMGHVCS